MQLWLPDDYIINRMWVGKIVWISYTVNYVTQAKHLLEVDQQEVSTALTLCLTPVHPVSALKEMDHRPAPESGEGGKRYTLVIKVNTRRETTTAA